MLLLSFRSDTEESICGSVYVSTNNSWRLMMFSRATTSALAIFSCGGGSGLVGLIGEEFMNGDWGWSGCGTGSGDKGI